MNFKTEMVVRTGQRKAASPRVQEQGVALITALMISFILSLLGMIILLSATGDTLIAANYRRTSQAFMASDAGISMAREELRLALLDTVQQRAAAAASSLVYPPAGGTPFDESQLTAIIADTTLIDPASAPISVVMANLSTRLKLTGFDGAVTGAFTPTITLELVGDAVIGPRPPAIDGIEQPPSSITQKFRYTITSVGVNNPDIIPQFQRTRTNSEQGIFNISIHPVPTDETTKVFSAFGAFYGRSTAGMLASGTFRGPVHTNEHFVFGNDNHVVFLEPVTAAGGNSYQYWNTAAGTYSWEDDDFQYNGGTPTIELRAGFQQVGAAAMPTNTDSQERAILDSIGNSAKPTAAELSSGLRNASNAPPDGSGSSIPNGVYISSADGNAVTGGGIYVQGDVDDVQMSVSGESQVFTIRQGGTTTTVTVTPPGASSGTGTTTITSSGMTTTFTGVPLDKSNPVTDKVGTLLFVKGNINGLHGPAVEAGQSTTGAAINSAVNVASSGDITITGDLKYEQQILDATGDPLPGWETAQNVLGVFTNSGKITIKPEAGNGYTANQQIFIDGALMAFNEAVLAGDSNAETGGVLYDVAGYDDVFLRGSRAQSKGLAFYGDGRRNDFYDPRFRNGSLAPPFAPVAKTTTSKATASQIFVANGSTLYNTWQRVRS